MQSHNLRTIFNGLTVLVTGNTGFKGSWLCIWLRELGANVVGYSIGPPTEPNNFSLSKLNEKIIDIRGDIKDIEALSKTIETYKPSVVFHLAAQPIVLKSFDNPKYTIDTNVGGTVNVLEMAKKYSFIKAVVCITSDKCYKDVGSIWGYKETDLLGGHDPYSASKAMAELAIESYNKSFFLPMKEKNTNAVSVASVRAGNVIGGGDFADFRLVPDCMRALMNKKEIEIRNPQSVRPWQIVFEPLSGYLWTAANLLQDGKKFSEPWNFGPMEQKGVSAKEIAEKVIEYWGSGKYVCPVQENQKKETEMLRLNWDKAALRLDWGPTYSWNEAIAETVAWFKAYEKNSGDMYQICAEHIEKYTEKARALKRAWAL